MPSARSGTKNGRWRWAIIVSDTLRKSEHMAMRETFWTPERAYGLARTMRYGGATYAQIAEACGINIATAWRYTGDISQ